MKEDGSGRVRGGWGNKIGGRMDTGETGRAGESEREKGMRKDWVGRDVGLLVFSVRSFMSSVRLASVVVCSLYIQVPTLASRRYGSIDG